MGLAGKVSQGSFLEKVRPFSRAGRYSKGSPLIILSTGPPLIIISTSTILYAAYRLQQGADKHEFGRGAKYSSRRQTKPLYYFVVIELLRDILNQENLNSSNKGITAAFHALIREDNAEAFRSLLDEGINIIDEYMNQESDECIYKEPAFQRFQQRLEYVP